MYKILGSEAFKSIEGRSKIEQLLDKGTQDSVQNALNEMIERKIMEYSSMQDPEKDTTSFKIGDVIEVNFRPDSGSSINPNDPLSEKEIVNKY